MNNKKVLPALVAVAVIALASFGVFGVVQSFTGSTKYNIETWNGDLMDQDGSMKTQEDDGSLGGLVHNVRENFSEGIQPSVLNYGSRLAVASGSKTYTATDICTYGIIDQDGDGYASVQAQTLPTGTSIISRCMPSIGDQRRILFWNSSVDELATINFSTNGYLDALIASSSSGSVLEVPTDRGVWLKFLNFNGSSISITFEEVRDSD